MFFRFTFLLMLISTLSAAQNINLLVGTYTGTGSKGIYVYKFNVATGKATLLSSTDSAANPSYLALSSNSKFLYAVSETDGMKSASVSAYAFDAATGRLKFLNNEQTGGDNPCYVAVHKSNKWVTAANYSGGSATVFGVNENGSLKPRSQLVQHTGSSANTARQEKAHVHQTLFSPQHDFLFTPDLGTDKIMAYAFNSNAQRPLSPATPAFTATEPGSGPRHMTFHPNQRFAYVLEELSGMVSVFQYNKGKLTRIQRLSSHPAGYKGNIGSADIHVSPDGRFLYASNRGDANSIAVFAINPSTGRLILRDVTPTQGKAPRNFVIDPSGKYLLVANQNTNNIVVFRRNSKTGLLTPTGDQLEVPKPVCLVFAK